jgi:hypothetical protein
MLVVVGNSFGQIKDTTLKVYAFSRAGVDSNVEYQIFIAMPKVYSNEIEILGIKGRFYTATTKMIDTFPIVEKVKGKKITLIKSSKQKMYKLNLKLSMGQPRLAANSIYLQNDVVIYLKGKTQPLLLKHITEISE